MQGTVQEVVRDIKRLHAHCPGWARCQRASVAVSCSVSAGHLGVVAKRGAQSELRRGLWLRTGTAERVYGRK